MFIVRWILGFAVTVAAAVFAVLNRHELAVYWNPLGDDSVTLPVYLVVLGFMAAGFVLGGFVVWLNMGRLRSERRQQKKEIKTLKRQASAAEARTVSAPGAVAVAPAQEVLPVLSARAS